MNQFTRDFDKKTISGLTNKGISIVGIQAIPANDTDKYFTDTAYKLEWNGKGFIRTYSQVKIISRSSWNPATDL